MDHPPATAPSTLEIHAPILSIDRPMSHLGIRTLVEGVCAATLGLIEHDMYFVGADYRRGCWSGDLSITARFTAESSGQQFLHSLRDQLDLTHGFEYRM